MKFMATSVKYAGLRGDISPGEVLFDSTIGQSLSDKGYCKGNILRHKSCCIFLWSFLVQEIDSEGYRI